MTPKPNPADFTFNGTLQQPHYDNAVRAWEKLEGMELENLGWYQLYPLAVQSVASLSDKELHDRLLQIFPFNEGEEYVGSLVNHYRGRLKQEGKESLINQMCSNSLKRLIIELSK
jgi:hypothetical protein